PLSNASRIDGEVEDYAITLMGADFGDAPIAYPVVKAIVNPDLNNDGSPDATGSVWLGDRVDYDYSCSYVASAAASADDNDTTTNDEDGLQMSSQVPIGTPVPWTITVNSQGPVTGVQWGMWIDWNADGTFDDFYNDSVNTLSPTPVTVNVTAPANATTGFIVRVGAKAPGVPFTLADYGNTINNGEWEDYIRSTPLPVQLMYFNAMAKGCNVEVSWATVMERNSKYFEIEQSTDGADWKVVKHIAAAGTSSSVKKYSAMLPLTSGINNYFRLRMVDEDGNQDYSMIRVLRCDNRLPILIWPNPTTMKVQISGLPEGGTIRITEISGKEVMRLNNIAVTEMIGIESLPSAIYQVTILNKNGEKIEVQQLVKKN
ncbi:MAG: T9SS type A sorting domain-containing protein, partial [Taibaiella sp.]